MFDIKRILKKENAKDYILWTNKIEISSVLLKEKKIKILDVCDDIPFYFKLAGDEKGYRSSLKFFESAFSKTDIQIVSALKIKEKYMHLTNKEIIVIPNGHNIKIKINNTAIPAEVEKIPSPRIGFLGTLFRFIDDELLAYLIKSRPSYNYVFVGDVDDSFPINKIKNYKNVFLLGKKDKDMIPRYINSFDVCLNPFKVHEVNDSVNPVKVFEYLALQKKVISTFMYSLMKEKIADYILFARDREEFLKILDKTILESNFLNPLPSGLISEYHWDNLFENLILNLKEKKIYL